MATRKWRKSRREQRQFWKNATEEARYEYLVDSVEALEEIVDFHNCEEKALLDLLQKHVERQEKVAFIEIGCGPGRVIRKILRRVLEDPDTWGKSIKYVVGVDFEIKMINRAIESLIKKERAIRKLVMRGTAYEVAETMNTPVREVKKSLREKVFFIDADARFPFLRCESIVPVVAMMFGTLGNIPETNSILQRVTEICWPKGEALLVVFDRKNCAMGKERYSKLAQLDFSPLNGTEWKEEEGVGFFKSPSGFYSRWFYETELRSLLQRHFEKGFEITSVSKTGLSAVVRPKLMIRRKIVSYLASRQTPDKVPYLRLTCPVDGHDLEKGGLPLKQDSSIKCSESKHFYNIHDIMGFRVPLLEVNG